MKFLLGIYLIFLTNSLLWSAELSHIEILTPMPYVSNSALTETAKSKIAVTTADIDVVANIADIDIVAKVKSEIAPVKADLAPYFSSPAAFDTFVDQIVVNGKNKIIGNELNDKNLTRYYAYLGTHLVGGFADKIMEKQGITDPKRRVLWINKIMVPFNACINRSQNALYDANLCLKTLSSNLTPNLGLAAIYEITNATLAPTLPKDQSEKFKSDQLDSYRHCLNETSASSEVISPANTNYCALKTMKEGILKVTDYKLSKEIQDTASNAENAQKIKEPVWRNYKGCVARAGNSGEKTPLKDQFSNCVDHLVRETGTLLVQDIVTNKSTIKDNFSPNEISSLSIESMRDFKNCFDNLKDKNIRKDGMIETDKCKTLVTNNVTYKTVLKIFANAATDSFKNDSKLSLTLSSEGKRLLDKCWKENQTSKELNRCLKKTIVSFAQAMAKIKLDQSIPNSLCSKPALIADSLKQISACLEKQLPSNVSEDPSVNSKIDGCRNKLTLDIAQKVATESIKNKAIENEMSSNDIDSLIQINVNQNFVSCLGSSPDENKLNNCGGELKRKVSLTMASSLLQKNASGKISPEEIENLNKTLITEKFSTCLGSTPTDATLDECSIPLTKEATKAIALASAKAQIKEILNSEETPNALKSIEDSFVSCIDNTSFPKPGPETSMCVDPKTSKPKSSSPVDECIKQFALGFAKNLGELKLTDLMHSILGSQDYIAQKPKVDEMITNYNHCLDGAKNLKLQDGFIDKITECTVNLQKNGTFFVTSSLNTLMSSEQKDAATILIKNEFANLLPCLSKLLPSSPYNEKLKENVDSILRPMSQLLAHYIEYSPEGAQRTIDDIIALLSKDLKDNEKNDKTRAELLNLLYERGALDQLLKSMIQNEMKDSLADVKKEDISDEARAYLLSKEPYDLLFKSEDGKKIKDLAMEKILKPVLLDQIEMGSKSVKDGRETVQSETIEILINSPVVGGKVLRIGVQDKINQNLNFFTKSIAKLFFGKNSIVWDKVRETPKGKEAEEYIKNNMIAPKFRKTLLSLEEKDRYEKEAKRLVGLAIKGYGK